MTLHIKQNRITKCKLLTLIKRKVVKILRWFKVKNTNIKIFFRLLNCRIIKF